MNDKLQQINFESKCLDNIKVLGQVDQHSSVKAPTSTCNQLESSRLQFQRAAPPPSDGIPFNPLKTTGDTAGTGGIALASAHGPICKSAFWVNLRLDRPSSDGTCPKLRKADVFSQSCSINPDKRLHF